MSPVVPTQRDPGSSSGDQLLGFVAESLRRLEDSVSRGFDTVNLQLSKLPEQYVARREFDRYRDELTLDWQQAVAKRDADYRTLCDDHDKDIAEIKADARDRQVQARAFRMWLIGIGSAAGLGISGLVVQIATHH